MTTNVLGIESDSKRSQSSQVTAQVTASPEVEKVRQVFENRDFRSWFGGIRSEVRRDINAIPLGDLETLIAEFFKSLGEKDSLSLLDDLAELIPEDKLSSLITKYGFQGRSPSEMLAFAKSYLEKIKSQASPRLSAHLSNFFDSLISIFESIIGAFGIADFLKPSESEIQTDFKFQRVMMQITLFTMLLTALIPVIGPLDAITYVGGSFGGIWLMSIIYPHIRKSPSHLPKSVNWSKEVALCRLARPVGRDDMVQQSAESLMLARKDKKHVMLLGESGVGKTETIKALVHAVDSGEYPELSGLKFFYFNTADLVNSTEILGGGNKIIDHIKREGGRHLKNCVLIFDEIALACRDKATLGDQLKTELDNASGHFATVIAITTKMEYTRDILAKNPAFARRFIEVTIESTNKNDTVEVLDRYLGQKSPESLIDDDALDYVFEVTKGRNQPLAALNLLSQSVEKSRAIGNQPKSVDRPHRHVVTSSLLAKKPLEENEQSQALAVVKEKGAELVHFRQKVLDYKKRIFKAINDNGRVDPKQLKKFYLLQLLVNNLRQKSLEGSHLFIGKSLIDATNAEEESRQKTLADAIASGKSQITKT